MISQLTVILTVAGLVQTSDSWITGDKVHNKWAKPDVLHLAEENKSIGGKEWQ
jgi:hypothetical protein